MPIEHNFSWLGFGDDRRGCAHMIIFHHGQFQSGFAILPKEFKLSHKDDLGMTTRKRFFTQTTLRVFAEKKIGSIKKQQKRLMNMITIDRTLGFKCTASNHLDTHAWAKYLLVSSLPLYISGENNGDDIGKTLMQDCVSN